ncbi:pimeloyl-ACP methyl ester carboxylesterase [Sphingobium sp. B1D3A]|uniref:Pimeloyl-ACP methyl ester carboxylesterase n=2 Tax=Sphingobium lignivorans TaxID=2735886 RepID=A0ABR6NJ36_9SPHN|nr:pimeloyl-ACP methyl ester carboxylesterase [Sphingobium lignivorans]
MMSDASSALPTVVILHGFGGIGLMNRPLAIMLRRAGYRPVEITYDSWGTPLDRICERLLPRIAACGGGEAPLHIVAHSMGGLVARALITRERPAHLGSVVMLGTPNGGSEIADFLHQRPWLRPILGKAAEALVTQRDAATDALLGRVDYPVGIIAGNRPIMPIAAARLVPLPSDGKVSVLSTRLQDAADHIVLPLPHSLLPYHPSAHLQIRHFLATGRFFRDDAHPIEERLANEICS